MWSSFMVQVCKIIISVDAFYNFKNFDFPGFPVAERTKISPNWQKIWSVLLRFSGTAYHVILIFGRPVSNNNFSRKFFQFWKFWFWVFYGGNRAKLPISVCFTHIWGTVDRIDYIIKILIMISTGVLLYYFFK